MNAKRRKRTYRTELVPVNRLHLDLRNPRHEVASTEPDALHALFKDDKVLALALDLADRGELSPLEAIGAIPAAGLDGHYVVVEGNRRVAALQVLADPNRAPTSMRKQVARAAERASLPREVPVLVFESREAARPWIELRHLGEQEGVGTLNWRAAQKARAAGSNSRTSARANQLSLAVLDTLEAEGLLSKDVRRRVSLTTLTRYLGTPGVRAILGLSGRNEIEYTHDPHEVNQALLRLVMDSVELGESGRPIVHSRSSRTERLAYANTLRAQGLAPSSLLPEVSKPTPPNAAQATASKPSRRSGRNPDKRPNLFPRSFAVPGPDPVLRRLRDEAVTIVVENLRFSAAYLLRAIVEQSMVLFLKRRGRWSQKSDEKNLMAACEKAFKEAGISGRALSTLQKASHKDTPYSLHSLGHMIHGGVVPTAKDVLSYADTWQPVLDAIFDHLRSR